MPIDFTISYFTGELSVIIGHPSDTGVPSSLCNKKVVGSILDGALAVLESSLNSPFLSSQRPWCVVPCLWDIAHKRPLAILQKE